MLPKNKLSDICTAITLVRTITYRLYLSAKWQTEKAKENLTNEYKLGNEKNQSKEQRTQLVDGEKGEENSPRVDENSDEEEIRKWREKRLTQLKKKQEMKKDGVYLEICEKDFIPTVLKNSNVVCHFYDNAFKRCDILHLHLIKLANIHLATKFIKVEAKNCLFFMNKLNIKILPSLCLFIDGVLVKTCVGFEDFGNKDAFKTKDLEEYLFRKKLISSMEYSDGDEEA